MSSQLDKLKNLEGLKIKEVKLTWSYRHDDFFIESITFDNGSELALYAKSDGLIAWEVE